MGFWERSGEGGGVSAKATARKGEKRGGEEEEMVVVVVQEETWWGFACSCSILCAFLQLLALET